MHQAVRQQFFRKRLRAAAEASGERRRRDLNRAAQLHQLGEESRAALVNERVALGTGLRTLVPMLRDSRPHDGSNCTILQQRIVLTA